MRQPIGVVLPVNSPPAAGQLFHPLDFGLRENIRAVLRGQRQIVHVQRIFRREVAPGDAIAALHARALRDAVIVGPVELEIHRQIQRKRGFAN